MRCACASIGLALLLAGPASAQDAPVPLSESEFIERYRSAEPRFSGLAAQVTHSKALVFDRRALSNPHFIAERESVGGVAENFAGVSWTFDLGGRGPRIDSALSRVDAAKQNAARQRLVLVLDALEAYYAAVLARDRVSYLKSARTPLAETVTRVRAKASAGESAGYELDRLELELARHDERIERAVNQHSLAKQTIAQLIGATAKQLSVSGTLAVAAPPDLATLLSKAREQRFDLRAARAQSKAATLAATAAGRWWVPKVGLSGGIKTISAGGATDTGYMVSLNLGLPIFNRRQAERKRAQAEDQRARASINHLARAIPAKVSLLHAALVAKQHRLALLEKDQMLRASRLVSRARLLYREGEGDVVDVVDAHQTALQVGLRRLELQHLTRRAGLDLWRAVGVRLPGGVN